ncbi:MAG: 50S ribosomal protein L30 [Actinobacteria bacterium]|nr:50S ribosomal protein L30 [Actinomycetota bacterium]MCB9389849.1 50S ribosomal protein L30 [Acidimicrobiia bacterium]
MADLKITLVRSTIGTKPKHRATVKAMGLRRINDSRMLPDSPSVRGMIQRVRHLVEVEEN